MVICDIWLQLLHESPTPVSCRVSPGSTLCRWKEGRDLGRGRSRTLAGPRGPRTWPDNPQL